MAGNAPRSKRPLVLASVQTGQDRADFLNALDSVAPDLWPECQKAALAVRGMVGEQNGRAVLLADHAITTWARRHRLDVPWVLAMAAQRLLLVEAEHPWADRWLPIADPDEARRRAWKDPGPPQPFESESDFVARIRVHATTLGFFRDPIPRVKAGRVSMKNPVNLERTARDFERLARWYVLGESTQTIAIREVGTTQRDPKNVAKDVKTVVQRLHLMLGLPPRPRGRAGRRPLSARK
jgi:hypothetical protein